MTTSQQSQNKCKKCPSTSKSWPRWVLASIHNLYKVGLLTPKGICCITKSLYKHGANLMVLLEFARQMAPGRATLNQQYTYQQCYELALSLADYLNEQLQKVGHSSKLSNSPKIALLCANHVSSVLALFAAARLGADITLLNTDMSHRQIAHILAQQPYDMLICDDDFTRIVSVDASTPESTATAAPIIISSTTLQQFLALKAKGLAASQKSNPYPTSASQLPRQTSGKIKVLTGGTSGRIKFADREPSPFAMLMPFLGLLNEVELAKYQSVYIGTPFYHGYGLAALIISILLSARIFISDDFDTAKASRLITQHQIEIIILVPTMLKRLLEYDKLRQPQANRVQNSQFKSSQFTGEDNDSTQADNNRCQSQSLFNSVKRIISGGAKLDAHLAEQTLAHTGDTLFNLYGTSEAGFGVMATPADLHRYPDSIGKAIRGVRLQILPIEQTLGSQTKHTKQGPSASDIGTDIGTGIGILSLNTAWAMDNKFNDAKPLRRNGPSYISTGDLAYKNAEGYLFLKGRADDMIVSGGENVYPADIENELKQHPQVEQVAVISVDNEEFGKRLIAYVSLINRNKNNCLANSSIKPLTKPSINALTKPDDLTTLLKSAPQKTTQSITGSALMQWLKPKLARYQMPRQIIVLDEMPMTKTGKVSHVKLKAFQ